MSYHPKSRFKTLSRKVYTLIPPAKDLSPKITLIPLPDPDEDLSSVPLPKGKNIRVSTNMSNRIIFFDSKNLKLYLRHSDMLKTVEQASRFSRNRSITLDRTASYEVSLVLMHRLEDFHNVSISTVFPHQWYGETGENIDRALAYYDRLDRARNKQDAVNRDLALIEAKFGALVKKVQAKLLKKLTAIHNSKPAGENN